MKKFFLLNILLVIVLASGCNKDLGNYNYIDVDSLYVSNMPEELSITIGQEVDIDPAINTTLNQIKEDDLTFKWVLFDYSIADRTKVKFTIGTERHLKTVPKFLVGKYPTFLVITQKSTGRSWNYRFILDIQGAFGKYGWFILSDKNGESHLDYFQDDPLNWNSNSIIYRDINKFWTDEVQKTPLELAGSPLSLEVNLVADAVATGQASYLYINTSTNTYKVNQTAGFTVNKLKYNFKNEVAGENPKSAEFVVGCASFMNYAFKDNNLYSFYYTGQKYYNVPLNSTSVGTIFKLSRHMAVPMETSSMYTLIYDMEGKRFMRTNSSSARAAVASAPSADFDVTNTGMDELVWMKHTAAFNGQAVAIMRKGSQYFLVRINFTKAGAVSFHSIKEVTTLLTDVSQANFFAIDNKYGYLFYTANDKLYQFDMDVNVLKTAKTLGGKKVSMLKVERLVALTPNAPYTINNQARMDPVLNSIILGTYDENNPNSSGKVEFLHVQPLMGDLKETIKPMEGFGKVADIKFTDRS